MRKILTVRREHDSPNGIIIVHGHNSNFVKIKFIPESNRQSLIILRLNFKSIISIKNVIIHNIF